jgi:glutamate 5-kinase
MQDRSEFKKARRVVVKIGSSQLCENGILSFSRFRALASQVAQLRRRGIEVVLVTSGAVAAGVTKLGLTSRPNTLRLKQVCASAGQVNLMSSWDKALSVFSLKSAQILLTADDLADRRRFLNAKNTLISLVEMGVIPIVNENDTVAVEELKVGDNDTLGSMVASSVEADLFINLTDSDGLMENDPRQHPEACLVKEVSGNNCVSLDLAGDGGPLGTGGMYTKVRAANRLAERGLGSLIANGRTRDILERLIDGEELGTFFKPAKNQRRARKHWLAFAARPKGTMAVDRGAAIALVEKGKSLLPGGVTTLKGLFDIGDPVSIVADSNQEELGIGLSNYSSPEVEKIMGRASAQIESILGYSHSDEIIHRDNLVIFKASQ